jgi:Tfp pilus assembly protein PilO
MSSQASKQLTVGALLGLLACGAAYFGLGSKREELDGLRTTNEALEVEVEKGRALKASYEKLKKEVEEQEERIAELIKLFPLESERSRVTQMVQRLASSVGLNSRSIVNSPKSNKTEYYSEWETNFKYSGGFNEYGNFLSLVSGYDKIINISDMVMERNRTANAVGPVTIDFRLSIYVYDPKSIEAAKRSAAVPATSTSNRDKDED